MLNTTPRATACAAAAAFAGATVTLALTSTGAAQAATVAAPAAGRPAAVVREVHRADPNHFYRVRAGDSLSAIAARHGWSWQSLYLRPDNRRVVGPDPNMLRVGERLILRGSTRTQFAALSGTREAPVATVAQLDPPAPAKTYESAPATDLSYTAPAAPVAATAPDPAPARAGAATVGGSFQQCVIARESGGSAQVMNGSGHYGLYQFDASTWAANGGNPADFGRASVAEQNKVFANTYAASGTAPWAPYDGC